MREIFAQNLWLAIILIIWSLIWKGIALWRASQRKEKLWFVLILIINTLGLLEILYIFVFSKKEEKKDGN